MRFEPLVLYGAYLIHPEPKEDERGSFTRLFDADLFAGNGLVSHFPQQSLSCNLGKGTLRGMHYQKEPHGEAKLVRCSRGRICDVIVDIRKDSPTYLKHTAIELSEQNAIQLYIPRGFAHGFLTLEENSHIEYMIDKVYVPEAQSGLRFDDPKLNIEWPASIEVISERDRNFALLV